VSNEQHPCRQEGRVRDRRQLLLPVVLPHLRMLLDCLI
jgi:hypothetical protein